MSKQGDKNAEASMLDDVSKYYTGRIQEHGPQPLGVDWNDQEAQVRRFEQLCKILPSSLQGVSLSDLGCGYGALIDYLSAKGAGFEYRGYDVSQAMLDVASERHSSNGAFYLSSKISLPSEYCIASGIFNVKLEHTDDNWERYILSCLENINEMSSRGFAFNCLTAYSDKDKMKERLFYAQPETIFSYCMENFSRNVAVLHDYGMYEFTVLVKK